MSTPTEIKDNKKEDSFLSNHLLKILVILIFVGITFYIGALSFYFYNFNGGLVHEQDKWGQFGDYIGGTLNPLFAFLALIALLLTVVLQSRELKLSTKELAESSKALKEQSQALNLQNYESTFFQMIRLHHEIVNTMIGYEFNITRQGRACFESVYFRKFKNEYYPDAVNENQGSDPLTISISAYDKFFNNYQHDVGHYFRNLYTIYKFVDDSAVENKKDYTRIIRAQLSSCELSLLFYNSLLDKNKNFMIFIEKIWI
ncbi:MAG: putative phage abortive infection protein [Candidatus Hodarchaeales archaeon]|jgi:uncharacterized membrane protein